jgi:hypothetical protein
MLDEGRPAQCDTMNWLSSLKAEIDGRAAQVAASERGRRSGGDKRAGGDASSTEFVFDSLVECSAWRQEDADAVAEPRAKRLCSTVSEILHTETPKI